MSESRRSLEQQFDRILSGHGPAISRRALNDEAVAGIREELVREIALAIREVLPQFSRRLLRARVCLSHRS